MPSYEELALSGVLELDLGKEVREQEERAHSPFTPVSHLSPRQSDTLEETHR